MDCCQKIKNWRHYEVLNINKKAQKVEMFSVCAKKLESKFPSTIYKTIPSGLVAGLKLWTKILNFLVL